MVRMGKWILDSERTILNTPVMKVVEQVCRRKDNPKGDQPSDRPFTFYLLRSRDWCNVIPVTEDGKIVLVRQPRIGIARDSLEIPGGIMDAEDPDFRHAAIREMAEETGYAPLPHAQIVPLGWTYPNPAIQDNRCHAFAVGPVKRLTEQKLDAAEMIEVQEATPAELIAAILRETEPTRTGLGLDTVPADAAFKHALMLAGFLKLMLADSDGRSLLAGKLQALGRGQFPI